MPLLRFVILKQSADQRVGVSFVAEDEDELEYGALVSRLQHDGIAEAAGLVRGDRLLSINNVTVVSASRAAATIRSSMGDVDVVVERIDLHEAQRRHQETEQEASAGEAMRTLRGWFAEATTPRGSRTEPGLLSMMGQGVLRLMAPKEHHEAATLVGAHWRGFRTRALCYVWHWAAIELQRSARGRQVRSLVLPALREHAHVERAIATARRAKAIEAQAEEARQRCEYLRECRATDQFLEAEAAVPAPVSRIKKALSFSSKKKRNPNRVPLAENSEVHNLAGNLAGTSVSSRTDSSGARTPPPASPRGGMMMGVNPGHNPDHRMLGVSPAQPWCSPPKPPHTAPAKRSVRRTLSWTRRTSKHIDADSNSRQREIAL